MVDTDTQLITEVEVLPGNAPDNLGAMALVERSEAITGVPVEEVLGDAAYGDGDTRQAFADAGRTLIARVPGRPNKAHFQKRTSGLTWRPAPAPVRRARSPGSAAGGEADRFHGTDSPAASLPVRRGGLRGMPIAAPVRGRVVREGRTVQLHPQEALLQQARALQRSEAFAGYRHRRVVVEHRLARLVQLGIRQARYFGRVKTKFQLYLAATVANLTLVAAKAGLTGRYW